MAALERRSLLPVLTEIAYLKALAILVSSLSVSGIPLFARNVRKPAIFSTGRF